MRSFGYQPVGTPAPDFERDVDECRGGLLGECLGDLQTASQISATPCSALDKVISSQTWLDLSTNSASAVIVRYELEREVLEREVLEREVLEREVAVREVAVRKFRLLFDRQWV